MAGWRVGVLHSRNKAMVSAVRTMAHQCEASSVALSLIQHVLDEPYDDVAAYLRSHRRTLHKACSDVLAMLKTAGIPYIEPDAGVFVVVDLRAFLDAPTFEAETALYHRLLAQANVNLTPGQSMNCPVAGFFRICFAYNPPSVTRAALERVIAVLCDAK